MVAIRCGAAFDHQGLVLAAVEREDQGLQLTLRPGSHRQVLARAELAEQALGRGVVFQKTERSWIVDPEPLQQIHYRIAALHAVFAQEALIGVGCCRQRRQSQLLDHLLAGDVRDAGVVHGTESGDHAEQRNSQNAGADPEMPGPFDSVVEELR